MKYWFGGTMDQYKARCVGCCIFLYTYSMGLTMRKLLHNSKNEYQCYPLFHMFWLAVIIKISVKSTGMCNSCKMAETLINDGGTIHDLIVVNDGYKQNIITYSQ